MSDGPSEPESRKESSGTLMLVATPIGNLGDLSERARASLLGADLIACEDTRRTGQLVSHLGEKRPLLSLHEHNERQRVGRVLAELEQGSRVALVSDAGTPLVSDPGFRVVRAAIDAGHRVEAIPGPTACVTALVLSGLPPLPFTFAGFPPPKSGKRRRFLEGLKSLGHTLVLYESPHRISKTLRDALEVLGDRPAALSRELTKLHEETLRGRVSELIAHDQRRAPWKGELVLCIGAGVDAD